jgi:hypothetical protein
MATGGAGQGGGGVGGGFAGAAGGGVAGAGGTVPIGYCDTFADCELRSGCCGGSCQGKRDPKPDITNSPVCATACALPPPGPPTCGCVDHHCSSASTCLAVGAGECPYCPYGYQPGADGCQTCTCNSADAGVEAAPIVACHWPAILDATDAGQGACHAARFSLKCTGSNGVIEECLSGEPTQCPGGDSAMPGVSFTCRGICAPNEYGVTCGSVGPGSIGQPPAGCRGGFWSPGGTVSYCCPCQ